MDQQRQGVHLGFSSLLRVAKKTAQGQVNRSLRRFFHTPPKRIRYTGLLALDYTSVAVEAKGYKTSTKRLSATRTYPNLSDVNYSQKILHQATHAHTINGIPNIAFLSTYCRAIRYYRFSR